MEKEIIIALIGLVGISLGAFLSGLGYFIKIKAERQKNRKVVLFHLLEIRQLIKSEYDSPEDFTNEYFKACDTYFEKKGIKDTQVSDSLKDLIQEHFKNIIQTAKPHIDVSFISSFDKSVDNLSQDNPVLAHNLRERKNLKDFLIIQNKYIEKYPTIEEFKNDTEIIRLTASNHINKLNDSVIKDMLINIDIDINRLSWSCGFYTWLKCRVILKNKSKRLINFNDDITQIFDEFFHAFNDNQMKKME